MLFAVRSEANGRNFEEGINDVRPREAGKAATFLINLLKLA